MKYRLLLLLLTLTCFSQLSFSQNPIKNFELEVIEIQELGELYPIVDLKFKVTIDNQISTTISAIHCKVSSEDYEDPLIDSWVNLDGSNNGMIVVSTDTIGAYIISLGSLEYPLNALSEIKAKDVNGTEYEVVLGL